jgi:hypothetical protein
MRECVLALRECVRSIFSPHRIDFDCSEADEDANGCMRYSRSIGHNPVLVGVLASLDCQASLFCRPDQFSRSSFVDDNSCLLVNSLPSLFYTMSSHRDI